MRQVPAYHGEPERSSELSETFQAHPVPGIDRVTLAQLETLNEVVSARRPPRRQVDDEGRYRLLYGRQQRDVFAYILRRTQSFEDAADVFSETFLVAWRRLAQIPPDDQDALFWLYATARRVLANHYRKTERRAQAVRSMGAAHSAALGSVGDPGSGLSARELLKTLPEKDREVLMLVAWEGLRSNELGKVLGCSEGAARIRLHRARGALEDAMRAAERETGVATNGGVGTARVNDSRRTCDG